MRLALRAQAPELYLQVRLMVSRAESERRWSLIIPAHLKLTFSNEEELCKRVLDWGAPKPRFHRQGQEETPAPARPRARVSPQAEQGEEPGGEELELDELDQLLGQEGLKLRGSQQE